MFWLPLLLLGVFVSSSQVVEINDANVSIVQEVLKQGDNAMLYFYSNQCVHCKGFSLAFNALAEKSVEVTLDPSIKFYRVNVDASPELSVRFFVRFIPAVYHLHHGQTFALSQDARADIGKYFEERAWTQMKPVGWLMAPFGLWGSTFGYLARLAHFVLREAKQRNISDMQLIILIIMAALLLILFAAFLGYITRPRDNIDDSSSSKAQHSKRGKKKNE